ncbi:ricin B-like lectin [Marasmius fiardii PR-910]|nr:ricin B-like lectin [Marasmius fiardii PR-910]
MTCSPVGSSATNNLRIKPQGIHPSSSGFTSSTCNPPYCIMRSSVILTLRLLAFVAVAAGYQIQSTNPAFQLAGRQGGCISASTNVAGAPVVIHDCSTEDTTKHSWDFSYVSGQNSGPQQIKVFGDKCLDVTGGTNADVAASDATFQWAGTNKCVDLTNGNINDMNQLQIWTCDSNNPNQRWIANPSVTTAPPPPPHGDVQLLAQGNPERPPMCLGASSNADGADVAIAPCSNLTSTFPAGSVTWTVPNIGSAGQIKTFDGTKCLDVRGGGGSNGNALQIWSCVQGNTNQLWTFAGPDSRLISWVGTTKCVDVRNGMWFPGNLLQIWDCDANNLNQWWTIQSPSPPVKRSW